jgi:hypothetical protein
MAADANTHANRPRGPSDYRTAVMLLEQYWLWVALSQKLWGQSWRPDEERREDMTRELAAHLGIRDHSHEVVGS